VKERSINRGNLPFRIINRVKCRSLASTGASAGSEHQPGQLPVPTSDFLSLCKFFTWRELFPLNFIFPGKFFHL
jgi:hypothetical protein